MLESARIAVVVPAFNEDLWIAETIATMPSFVDLIVIVDDASVDSTAEEAARTCDPRVIVVRHPENRGVGAAIVTGYRRALAAGADAVAVMGGDGQMHPDDLATVVLPVVRRQHDYVKGNRLAAEGVFSSMPLARLVGTFTLAMATRHAAGLRHLSDSQCGYTAISAEALHTLGDELDRLWPRYGYPNDLLGKIALRQLRVGEVVVRPVYRGEKSGLRVWHLATISFVIARVASRRIAHEAGLARSAPWSRRKGS